MRKPIIVGNWKMNGTLQSSSALVKELKENIHNTNCDVVICPPFTLLSIIAQSLQNTNIQLGAQNVHFAEKGAYTGEIAPQMLVELGVKYVIIGHSERRQYFAETNQTVNQRTIAALQANLSPIVCVGESLTERENGQTESVLRTQIRESLKNIENTNNLLIAYEPVWAIGTGKTATPEEANNGVKFIRNELAQIFSKECAANIRILYGGSMNVQNCKDLMQMSDIDGGLIGGASLIAADFIKIVQLNNCTK